MKTIKIEVFTLQELEEQAPTAFSKVYSEFFGHGDWPWFKETVESLKAFVEALDYQLDSYRLSPGSYRDHILCSPKYDGVEDIYGVRAYAHIQNCLDRYRIPYGCKHKKYKDYRRYNKSYADGYNPYSAGKIEPCPFTGYYLDEILVEEVEAAVLKGQSLREAINDLHHMLAKVIDDDQKQCLFEYYQGSWFREDGTEFDVN